MEILIYKKDWLEIVRQGSDYLIRYDSGDIAGRIREYVITEEEALKAQESDRSLNEILLKYENLEIFGEEYMSRYKPLEGS